MNQLFMNKFFWGAIVIILTIIIGRIRSNKELDVETTKMLTQNVNFVGVIAPIAMILYTGKFGESLNFFIIKTNPVDLKIFAYVVTIPIFLVALLIAFKKSTFTRYIAIQNVIVSGSFIVYMCFANTKSNIGQFFVWTVTFLMIVSILMMDYYMNSNNDDIDDYKSMLSIGSVGTIMLGLIQLPWISARFNIVSIIFIVAIVYFLLIRKTNLKKNIINIGILILILATQLTIDIDVNKIIICITIVACIVQFIVCQMENTIDNWTNLLTLMIIGSSIQKISGWMIPLTVIAVGVMWKTSKGWFSKKD